MEELELLKVSAREIKQLRAQNREMSIRLQMFDHCMVLLNGAPQRQGMTRGPDIVYDIEKYIEQQEKEQAQKAGTTFYTAEEQNENQLKANRNE